MKKSLVALVAALGACFMAAQGAEAKSLEDVLKEKGVITEADYQEIAKSSAKLDYKLGKGFTVTSADQKFQLTMGGRVMVKYTFLDKDNGQDMSQFALATGQLWWTGYAFTKDLTYNVRINVGNSGKNTMLETAYVKYRFMDEIQLLAGQDKLAFGRQNLSAAGNLQFVAVSPVTSAFAPGYDLGAAASGNVLGGKINYVLGVSNGAGATTARSTNNNAFLARLQVNPFGAFGFVEADTTRSAKPLVTVGSSFYMNSLARNATGFETNNLGYAGTSGWLGKNVASFATTEKVDINSVNIDAAVKWMGASAQAEYFWAQGDGQLTNNTVRAQGYYLQAGYMVLPKLEVAMRYSYLDPNRDAANDSQTEILGGVSYYFNNHAMKVQADVGNIHTQKSSGILTDDMQYRMQVAVVF
ncbi:MAG: porin [Geobacteraceae bacterium]|nr:porin [Geobacteraceae bacterium]